MPRCGSQITLCDVPIRFDTYKGCTHGCKYCFTYKKWNISNVENDEGEEALKAFIGGKRRQELNWCDFDIPLHWGGMSDPFQPIEKEKQNSLRCLRILQQSQYPFIVSTKSTLIVEGEYYELIKKSNVVVQLSAVCEKYDEIETGAPTWKKRVECAKRITPHTRVVIRIQPYMPSVFKDVMQTLDKYKEVGVYGIVVEGIKYFKKTKGTVKAGGDYVYPIDVLRSHFEAIKNKAHRLGLRFYCGENRLRSMSDDLCCCGVDGLGWKTNKANLNHYHFDRENFAYTDQMKKAGTTHVFVNGFFQTQKKALVLNKMSYQQVMDGLIKDKKYNESVG